MSAGGSSVKQTLNKNIKKLFKFESERSEAGWSIPD